MGAPEACKDRGAGRRQEREAARDVTPAQEEAVRANRTNAVHARRQVLNRTERRTTQEGNGVVLYMGHAGSFVQ